MKRYFALVWPKSRATLAVMLSGYERDGKVITKGNRIGFALDYYPDEKRKYEKEYGKTIVGDCATRQEAEAAVEAALQ